MNKVKSIYILIFYFLFAIFLFPVDLNNNSIIAKPTFEFPIGDNSAILNSDSIYKYRGGRRAQSSIYPS